MNEKNSTVQKVDSNFNYELEGILSKLLEEVKLRKNPLKSINPNNLTYVQQLKDWQPEYNFDPLFSMMALRALQNCAGENKPLKEREAKEYRYIVVPKIQAIPNKKIDEFIDRIFINLASALKDEIHTRQSIQKLARYMHGDISKLKQTLDTIELEKPLTAIEQKAKQSKQQPNTDSHQQKSAWSPQTVLGKRERTPSPSFVENFINKDHTPSSSNFNNFN